MSKKIFITGATGFIGSHLCEMSVKKGYKVVGFDRYNSSNDLGCLKNSKYKDNIDLILGDIRDYDSVCKSMKGCDKVFHLAALIGIPYSYVSPLAYLKTNVEGTYNILEAAKNLKLKNVIVTSTSEVYGSAKYLPIDEEHPLNAQSPYAASKISADQLTLSYYKSFNLPVKIIRPFNTFGPRQSSRAVIPRIIIQCLNKKNKKLILGSLKPTRDFNFVEDTCEAYFDILKNKELIGKTINVGSNTNISIENIAKKIMQLTRRKLNFIENKQIIRPKLSEVDNLQCDNKKIKNLTNWKPRIKLDNGLKKTIKWIRDNYSEYSEKYEI
jgi:NAD dependent epimerase/dehydratase